MKKNYIYPAIFEFDEDGISIEFPDFDGAFSCADTFEEALEMAKDCLELNLMTLEEDKEEIPEPKSIENYKLKNNQKLMMVVADMISFKKRYSNKTVKKTLTIPKWLNDLGIEKKVNFSAILKEALIKELGV